MSYDLVTLLLKKSGIKFRDSVDVGAIEYAVVTLLKSLLDAVIIPPVKVTPSTEKTLLPVKFNIPPIEPISLKSPNVEPEITPLQLAILIHPPVA